MFSVRHFIRLVLLLDIFLLPLAHLKLVIFGVPFYSIELPIVVALSVYGYGWKKGWFSPTWVNFQNPFFLGIVFFVGGALLSFVANPFSLTGLGMLKTWFVFPLLFVWLWIEMDPDGSDVEYALLAWLSTIVIGALISMVYFFSGAVTYDGRLTGWYTSPNYLAFFLSPGILLAYFFFFHPLFSKKRLFRSVCFVVFILLAVTLFFTHSYGVWISLVLAVLFVVFFEKTAISWRKKLATVTVLAVLCGSFILSESGSEKWQAVASFQERSSLASRVTIWQAAIRIIAERPFLGIGIGRFQEVYLTYQPHFPPYLEWAVPQPHNLYLALWLQTGLVGLLGFLFLVGAWMVRMMVIGVAPIAGASQSVCVLLVALLILILVTGLVDTPFFKTDLAFVFWYCIAFGMGLLKTQKKRSESR